jgi:AcrR family transcriptional regulator
MLAINVESASMWAPPRVAICLPVTKELDFITICRSIYRRAAGGYSGFSYADIAEVVGIRKASIHHHFPSKVDLVRTLGLEVRAYFRALSAWLTSVLERGARHERLRLSSTPRAEAEAFMATVHGAMLSARAYKDLKIFGLVIDHRGGVPEPTGAAGGGLRAHRNLIENLLPFAIAVTLAHAADLSNTISVVGTALIFIQLL